MISKHSRKKVTKKGTDKKKPHHEALNDALSRRTTKRTDNKQSLVSYFLFVHSSLTAHTDTHTHTHTHYTTLTVRQVNPRRFVGCSTASASLSLALVCQLRRRRLRRREAGNQFVHESLFFPMLNIMYHKRIGIVTDKWSRNNKREEREREQVLPSCPLPLAPSAGNCERELFHPLFTRGREALLFLPPLFCDTQFLPMFPVFVVRTSSSAFLALTLCLSPPHPPFLPVNIFKRKQNRETKHQLSARYAKSHAISCFQQEGAVQVRNRRKDD